LFKLIIGNRAYSSWSMRGWLACKQSGDEFEELVVPMFDADWDQRREGDEFAPSLGKVPILWDGEIVNEILPNDQGLAADLEKGIHGLAAEQVKEMAQGTQDDWTWESHELAMKDVYYKLHVPVERPIFPKNCDEAPTEIRSFKPPVDPLYVDTMKPVVREQLTKAGLRLARLLNESL